MVHQGLAVWRGQLIANIFIFKLIQGIIYYIFRTDTRNYILYIIYLELIQGTIYYILYI